MNGALMGGRVLLHFNRKSGEKERGPQRLLWGAFVWPLPLLSELVFLGVFLFLRSVGPELQHCLPTAGVASPRAFPVPRKGPP